MLAAVRKLTRNTLFRLSLLSAFLFVISLFVSLGYIYYATHSSELRRVEQEITKEIAELQLVYDKGGAERVILEIQADNFPSDYSENDPAYQQLYDMGGIEEVGRAVFLRGANYEGLYIFQTPLSTVGNLAEQAVQTTEKEEGFLTESDGTSFSKIDFFYSDPRTQEGDQAERRGRGLAGYFNSKSSERLAGIVVARDVESIMRTGARVRTAILTSSAIALLLGLLSSWYVSRRFAQRVEGFNRLATDVRAGHLDRRAPRNYSEDEMDMLAEHLNAMLDHIDRLMKAMRYAGDSVAHDLRTPLTRLRTRLESAAVELGDSEEANVLFAAANDAGELLSTFDSVLRIARLEAGERRELLKPLDPKPILDDLAELYAPACEDSGLDFSFEIAEKTQVMADRGLLSQAVSNLLENAIKYTPRGGAIHLSSIKGRQGRVTISVTDNGPGIPSWDRERVKERFVRLDKSRTLPGSGLGLALVDAVADLHRAEFKMDDGDGSDPDRPGLKASLIFPRHKSVVPQE